MSQAGFFCYLFVLYPYFFVLFILAFCILSLLYNTQHKHPCPRRYSNPQCQQSSGRTTLALGHSDTGIGMNSKPGPSDQQASLHAGYTTPVILRKKMIRKSQYIYGSWKERQILIYVSCIPSSCFFTHVLKSGYLILCQTSYTVLWNTV
jgi:hypothetical protein